MTIIVGWLSAALGLFVASRVLKGVKLASFGDALWAGALLGALQWGLHWLIFVGLGIATLGIGFLLWFITNWIASAIVVLIASKLSSRLEVEGFLNALVTAFLVAATSALLRRALL